MPIPTPPPASRDAFQIAIICALPEERDAVETAMTRDYKGEGHVYGRAQGDDNHYTTGEFGRKPVVLATPRNIGTINTSHLVTNMRYSFPNLVCVLVVGIAGGALFRYDKPTGTWNDSDIHLGDVIVSTQVIGYDFGAEHDDSFKRKTAVEDIHARAPVLITTFLNEFKTGKSRAFKRVLQTTNADLKAWGDEYERPAPKKDCVYPSAYRHKHRDQAACEACSRCTEWHDRVCEKAVKAGCGELGCIPHHTNEERDTKIHLGRVASGNAVMKSAHRRDKLVQEEDCIAFEMEGAGTWDVVGTIVVKGVVDYADSHKNKTWRLYPAARAALCAKALIEEIELADGPQARYTDQGSDHHIPFSTTGLPVCHRFVERKDEMQQLESYFNPQAPDVTSQKSFLLHGLGGMGKTQLAVKYALEHHRSYSAVIWLDGSSEDRLKQSFVEAAHRVPHTQLSAQATEGLQSSHMDINVVVKGVLRWLSLPSNKHWLMIIDNVDRDFKGEDPEAYDVTRYLPTGYHGSIIITSRLPALTRNFEGSLRVDMVDEEQARAILESNARRSIEDVQLIINRLVGLPLALAQAGAYLSCTGISGSLYVKHYDRTWKELLQKQQDRFPLQEYKERSILTTWTISYEQVMRQSEAAGGLMRLWGILASEDLWYQLVASISEHEDPTKTTDWLLQLAKGELEFSDAVGLLAQYSLVESRQETSSYSMHSVLHRWCYYLCEEEERSELFHIAVYAIAGLVIDDSEPEYWKLQRRLLLHRLRI